MPVWNWRAISHEQFHWHRGPLAFCIVVPGKEGRYSSLRHLDECSKPRDMRARKGRAKNGKLGEKTDTGFGKGTWDIRRDSNDT